MSITEEMPLLSIQELATRHAPKIYRPHTTQKPKAFDWDAITPTCKDCGTRTGAVNAHNGLCPTCDSDYVAPAPEPKPAPVTRKVTSTRGRGHKHPLDTEAAIEAYTGGQTLNDIAKALGVQYHRVRDTIIAAGIELRDDRNRRVRTCPHGIVSGWRTCDDCREAANARRRVTNRAPGRNPVDEAAIIRGYVEDHRTSPDLVTEHGTTPHRIRNILDRAGIQRRDDRTGHSGGRNKKDYDLDVVAKVRDLYLERRLSQTEVATELNLTRKIVDTIMRRHQIPARQGETGHIDGAAGLKAEIEALGVPVRDIKAWGLDQGLLFEIAPGIPPRRVFDAYVNAHPERKTA